MLESKLIRAVEMMIKTDHMHKHLIDGKASTFGMRRTQHRILMYLARHGILTSQKELAEHLDITAAAVTGALKKIESEGYIERKLGRDNRFNELCLTEKGRMIVEQTRLTFKQTDTSLFDGFSDEELDIYISCLIKLQNNIKRQMDDNLKGENNNEKMDEIR